jgi:leucyl/phenylalanyl-tRNA--protein transferase
MYLLPDCEIVFPPVAHATAEGLLAVGGDLRIERLLAAYEGGIFPWYDEPPILWFAPDPRFVLTPGQLRVSKSLRRTVKAGRYRISADTAFEQVIHACATVPRPGQYGTWINPDMLDAYGALHRAGYAHSVEAWRDDELVGGLYGVSLGAAFFGESMFAAAPDASKVAFVHLVQQLERWQFQLIDCQVQTDHLARFGAVDWPRSRFMAALSTALAAAPTRRGVWTLD